MTDTIKAYLLLWELGLTEDQLREHIQNIHPSIQWGKWNTSNSPESNNRVKFRIWVSHNNVNIEGSLCKFHYGNNLQTLNRETTEIAINKLAEILQLPIDLFILSRLDIAENLSVLKDTSSYIDTICGIDKWSTGKYNMKSDATGIYFNQSRKTILLYDKRRHENKKGGKKGNPFLVNKTKSTEEKPFIRRFSELFGNNILRIEYRFIKAVGGQLLGKGKDLRLGDLSNEAVYNKMVRYWFRTICQFQYQDKVLPDLTMITDLHELEEAIYCGGIAFFGGAPKIIKSMRRFKSTNAALKSRKCRMIKRIRKLGQVNTHDSEGRELFLEVRRKAMKIALQHLGRRPFKILEGL